MIFISFSVFVWDNPQINQPEFPVIAFWARTHPGTQGVRDIPKWHFFCEGFQPFAPKWGFPKMRVPQIIHFHGIFHGGNLQKMLLFTPGPGHTAPQSHHAMSDMARDSFVVTTGTEVKASASAGPKKAKKSKMLGGREQHHGIDRKLG